jgi:hypothetical protein
MTAETIADSDWNERLEARRLAVKEVADQMIAELHEPRGFGTRRNERVVLALVAVPKLESHLSYFVSVDGDDSRAVAVPKSQLTVVASECGGLFMLAIMKGWIAADRHFAQANIPGKTKARKWTDDERAGWKILQKRIVTVRQTLNEERRRGAGLHPRQNNRSFAIRRGDTA